jgi:hypothetical protein
MNIGISLILRRFKGWVVSRSKCLGAGQLVAFGLSVLSFAFPTNGQGLRTVVESRDKVFPGVAAGIAAMKRDSSGRYYILAKPATVISVYRPDGSLADQIPNAKSNGATIRYAVDIDLNPDGFLVVADRGANAIEVFAPDGSLVSTTPVMAPTSIVALADGQFAVTSLTSKRLVQVIDGRGKVVRSFGDPSDIEEQSRSDTKSSPSEKQPLMNLGKISGDASGGIYFAFTSLPDPTLRKYDRYGYVGYEASIPANMFTAGETRPLDRAQFTFGFSDTSLSNQTSAFLTMGSSNDVQFGGGVGTGLGEALRQGMGYGQALQQQVFQQPGTGGGPFGAMFSGDVTDQGASFQLGMGRMSAFGGRGRGRMGSAAFGDQATDQGALLQFGSSNSDGNDNASDSGPGSYSSQSGTTAELGMFGSSDSTTNGPSSGYTGELGTQNLGTGGLPSAFVLGSAFNTIGFRPQGLAGGPLDQTSGGGTYGHEHSGAAGAKGPGSEGFSHFGYHGGRYRSGTPAFTAGMRVNLGDLGRVSAFDKPVINAMAIDPETQEIWAGIGDTLVHFSKDGSPVGIYYLTLAGATPVKPTALLIEPNRVLIAADPWGIFEFARPDKPVSAPTQQLNVVPQVVPQPR